MEYPKCRSKNIYFTRINKMVNQRGIAIKLKRYFCVDCNHNLDFD